MLETPLVAAGTLLATLVVGLIVHELSHALALRLAGVSYEVTVLPRRDGSHGILAAIRRPLATVTPAASSADLSPWQLRAAAMMPLSLLAPLALVIVGLIPDPFAAGNLPLQLATIAWLGCALPSPADFSKLWYPDQAMSSPRVPRQAEDPAGRRRAPGR